jgi:dipeptidyl aminopeptidase/acylaminoacyl peptidase
MKKIYLLLSFILYSSLLKAQENLSYKLPPKEIADLVLAPSSPRIMLDGSRSKMLLLTLPEMPDIEELAAQEIKVAGIRINPSNNGPSRATSYTDIKLRKSLVGADVLIKGLPQVLHINNIAWSPDSKRVAFINTTDSALELWLVNVENETAEKISSRSISNIFGSPLTWINAEHLLFTAVPENRGKMPEAPKLPSGPVVQENMGKKAPSRTYQDLIKNPYDEALFEYFATSTAVKINVNTKKEEVIVSPAIIETLSPSPDGNYIFTGIITKPFSYLVPYSRFPFKAEIIDQSGKKIKTVAELPLAENIPVAFNAVRTGPRGFNWRSDVAATIYWAEAQDGGDPKTEVKFRDKVFVLPAPFTGSAQELFSTTLRFNGIQWGDATTAISYESWWTNRKEIRRIINPTTKTSAILSERSSEDKYNDPGFPQTHKNIFGKQVLRIDNNFIYLSGEGASPEGDRPFIDRVNLKTKKAERLWRSEGPFYESPVAIIDTKDFTILTGRESKTENPNYFIRNIITGELKQITRFPHPYPQLKDVEKQQVRYKRADGVDLNLDLYLPAGYKKEQGPLPGIVWAYPEEFKSSSNAGQMSGSPHKFTRLYWGSPIYWVTQGYAVLDNTSIPIVGEGDKEPNDTFIEQLVMSAKAAIDKCAEMGVLDPKRVAVGGHSYGAFMTANLLAHSDLFAAGIARSGAYNRTFTPFGFQSEERTFWEVPEVYNRMSPFNHANKIKRPLLLIHGEADNNPGTFPIQSERLYNAVKGHGGITRYVSLPFESHGYRAKESVLHTLWEQHQWLEKFVKGSSVPVKLVND